MSNYKKVEKQSNNPYLNLYKLDAVDREGKVFDYYFVSRRDEEGIKLKTKDNNPEGIVVYAITDEESPRLLVIKEYRYPLDDYIYELPAGIIDSGEVAEQAAVRAASRGPGLRALSRRRPCRKTASPGPHGASTPYLLQTPSRASARQASPALHPALFLRPVSLQ